MYKRRLYKGCTGVRTQGLCAGCRLLGDDMGDVKSDTLLTYWLKNVDLFSFYLLDISFDGTGRFVSARIVYED